MLTAMLSITSCSKDELPARPGTEDYSHTQTLLMYMIADNNLSSFISQDLNECCRGYLAAPGNINLQVYIDNHDNNRGLPMLMNVRRTAAHDKLIFDTLQVWSKDQSSVDPDIMSGIIQKAFSGVFDTPVKGIVISSHGYAWTPSPNYKEAASRGTVSTNWIGQDNTPTTRYMEIWDLHDALKQSNVDLSYIMFDACFMSNVETAYEIRDCARYMVSSACEIQGDGYNYMDVIPELSKVTGKDGVMNALSKVIDCYGRIYNDECEDTGELCLLDLSQMDNVAAAYKKIRAGKTLDTDIVVSHDSISTSGKPLARIQSYGRFYVGTYYDYFDLAECASKLGDDGTLRAALDKAVIREFHASKFRAVPDYMAAGDRIKGTETESFPFTACSGVSVSLPEIFQYSVTYNKTSIRPTLNQMQSAYNRTQWGRYMGL